MYVAESFSFTISEAFNAIIAYEGRIIEVVETNAEAVFPVASKVVRVTRSFILWWESSRAFY
jgi:hypothetical protein